MNIQTGTGLFSNEKNPRLIKYRPFYKVNENNILELMDYYFPGLEKGDYISLTKRIIQSKISLNELEYISEKLLPHLQIIWYSVRENPTQANLLDYAIECFVDNNWDSSEKELERINTITELKKATVGVQKFDYSKEYEPRVAIEHYYFSELYHFPIFDDLLSDTPIKIDYDIFANEKNDMDEKSKNENDKTIEDDESLR